MTTVADDLLPALPPPLAKVQQPKALVANVRCHYQPTCEENENKASRKRKVGNVVYLEGHLANSRSIFPWLQPDYQCALNTDVQLLFPCWNMARFSLVGPSLEHSSDKLSPLFSCLPKHTYWMSLLQATWNSKFHFCEWPELVFGVSNPQNSFNIFLCLTNSLFIKSQFRVSIHHLWRWNRVFRNVGT